MKTEQISSDSTTSQDDSGKPAAARTPAAERSRPAAASERPGAEPNGDSAPPPPNPLIPIRLPDTDERAEAEPEMVNAWLEADLTTTH